MLAKWTQKTTWYLAEVKGGVQAFTTERGVDFSIRRLITEEYLAKIRENKLEPMLEPRNIAPAYAILGVGLLGLAATSPSF